MIIGHAHLDRVKRESQRRDVVLLPHDATSADAERAASDLAPGATLFLHGAEHPRFDGAKARLIDLGHMGPCAEAPGAHLWWGAADGWAKQDPLPGAPPIIVSYYTIDTPYEDEARELMFSCDELALEHRIVGVPPRGAWERNCAMKAGFVYEVWRTLGRPVLWVDADARMRRRPDLLSACDADFGVHKAARWQFASGTVFFGATDLAGEMLRTWQHLCDSDPMTWDQVHLDHAWEQVSSRAPLETVWLPQAYTRIFDRPEEADGGGRAVVEHFQASRRLKSVVSAGVARPYRDVDDATKASRRASRPRVA